MSHNVNIPKVQNDTNLIKDDIGINKNQPSSFFNPQGMTSNFSNCQKT